jgi:hypothetical protein
MILYGDGEFFTLAMYDGLNNPLPSPAPIETSLDPRVLVENFMKWLEEAADVGWTPPNKGVESEWSTGPEFSQILGKLTSTRRVVFSR